MKVLKFGGSSVATAERLAQVADIVRSARGEGRLVVVVSALGGVTDALLAAAGAAQRGAEDVEDRLEELERRHLETARAVVSSGDRVELERRIHEVFAELREFLRGVALVGEVSPRSLDRILACGEVLSAPIVAAALRYAGVDATAIDARELIITDAVHGNARPESAATQASIRSRLGELPADGSDDPVPVVTGFIAATPAGETTTLGRGGSDFTAAILAAALGAEALELWTDVDGVMSADPRMVPEARPIRRLRYDELMELSHFGAKVVHPPSVHPVRACGMPLWIKSTFEPEGAGTLVTDEPEPMPSTGPDRAALSPIRGITSIHAVAMARLEGDGMVGVPGVAMRLFGSLARRGVSVILITQGSSEHSICFAVAPEDLESAREAVDAEFAVDRRAGDIDELRVEDDVAVVAVVGAAMRQHPGIAGRLFSVLGACGINVRAIAQGSSELNISLVVKAADEARAVRAIHRGFFEPAEPVASVFLAGVGGVGGALLEQLEQLAGESGSRLRLEGVADSRKAWIDATGIAAGEARAGLARESESGGSALASKVLVERALAGSSSRRIFVDCTAADGMAPVYERLLAGGVAVVTANKKPLAGDLESFRRLTGNPGARLYHEATVGAGLPVVRTLADLLATGDSLTGVEGVFSGTASFLAARLARGERFSAAVARARELGYTEPDPREDLAGEDVARKLLILLRLAGTPVERGDLEVEPWLPAEPWSELAPQEFLERMPELDDTFQARQEGAAARGSRLAYVASWRAGANARVALSEIAPDHPCYGLASGENLIAFTTRRYAKMPLVVRGPGAGPEVTAAGVFSDILRAVSETGPR